MNSMIESQQPARWYPGLNPVWRADESPLNDMDDADSELDDQAPDADQLIEALESLDEGSPQTSDPVQEAAL
ncbi:hypothetical protein DN824_14480 [Stutzerimonas nosocomialis]|uniref:hypothetical protein n=1 Tax=Stutzerimonas nosocomialis TaxID=1056496 RepID=UPI00110808F4|nr:hypothetical protein DN824_14480 [Stutzerimonas nosocomialis]